MFEIGSKFFVLLLFSGVSSVFQLSRFYKYFELYGQISKAEIMVLLQVGSRVLRLCFLISSFVSTCLCSFRLLIIVRFSCRFLFCNLYFSIFYGTYF